MHGDHTTPVVGSPLAKAMGRAVRLNGHPGVWRADTIRWYLVPDRGVECVENIIGVEGNWMAQRGTGLRSSRRKKRQRSEVGHVECHLSKPSRGVPMPKAPKLCLGEPLGPTEWSF